MTAEEIEAFEDDRPDAPICTPEEFRVCFHNSWKKCAFNAHARYVFIKAFLDSVQNGYYEGHYIPKELLTEDAVGSAIDGHMQHAREQWRLYQKESWETLHEQQLTKNAVSSRKKTVSFPRLTVALTLIAAM